MKVKQQRNPKEYLKRLFYLDRRIEIKRKVLEEVEAQIGICAMSDPDQHVSSKSADVSDPVFNYVAKVTDLRNQLNRMIDHYIDLKAMIIQQIDGLDNQTFSDLLTCRYVLMQNWEQVAQSMGYDVRHCTRLHGLALQEFARKYL